MSNDDIHTTTNRITTTTTYTPNYVSRIDERKKIEKIINIFNKNGKTEEIIIEVDNFIKDNEERIREITGIPTFFNYNRQHAECIYNTFEGKLLRIQIFLDTLCNRSFSSSPITFNMRYSFQDNKENDIK